MADVLVTSGSNGPAGTSVTERMVDQGDGTWARKVTGPVTATPATPLAANILDGYATFNATTGATTLATVPAGRTWVGIVEVSAVAVNPAANAAVSSALGVISVAGAGATPPAGNYLGVEAGAGANAATGAVGTQGNLAQAIPMTVIAPVGNTVTVQVTTTIVTGRIDASAIGALQ